MKNAGLYHPNKVAIIGAGFVGSTIAYALMQSGAVSELVLIDKNAQKAEGEALDLQQGIQFTSAAQVTWGSSMELVAGAQVVVIAAGKAQKPGETRTDLLQANTAIFKEIIPEIVRYNKNCMLLVVTNPVDVMTYVTLKLSGFQSCAVFGTGTVLDTARLRYILGDKLQVSPKDIIAHVLGEHGDAEFVAWDSATVAGIPLAKMASISDQEKEKMARDVREAAYTIINKKGATYYAIALVVAKIVRAILLNQSRVFTLSSAVHGYDGISDVCMSVPTIVSSVGVCKILPSNLSAAEHEQLKKAAEAIKQGIAATGL